MMKQWFCAACLAATCLVRAEFIAVENGRLTADIVLPMKPGMVERYAAEELRYHLGKATGKAPEIVTEDHFDAKRYPYHFFVGNTRAAVAAEMTIDGFPPDGYLVRTSGNALYLRGVDRDGAAVGNGWSATWHGTLYAVYDFLEHELGCRWLWPGELGEFVPAHSTLKFDKIDRNGHSPLVYRAWRQSRQPATRLRGWTSPENRDRYYEAERKFLIRHRFGAVECYNYGHAFTDYWRRFGKTHPEFFSLLPDGRRAPLDGDDTGQFITMCVSTPGLWKQIVAGWRKSPRRRPGNVPYLPHVELCENDTPGMCTCAACRAWDAPDERFAASAYWSGNPDAPLTRRGRFLRLARADWGEEGGTAAVFPPSLSDRYAKFYNAVLAEARKVDPQARVIGYAYANYVEGPRETELDPGVIISFVPSYFFPYTQENSRTFRAQWTRWRDAGVRDLLLRPNFMLAGANFPIDFRREVASDFAWAYRHGMFGAYFDSLTGAWGTQGPMLYTLARIHREPGLTSAEADVEYFAAFAPAEREVRAYFDYWTRHSRAIDPDEFRRITKRNPDRGGSPGGGHSNFTLTAAEVFPAECFLESGKLLDAAEKAAVGSPVAARRVRFLRAGWQDALLTRECRARQIEMEQDKAAAEKKAAFRAAFQKLCSHRASVEGEFVCNFGHHADYEAYSLGWPHPAVKLVPEANEK